MPRPLSARGERNGMVDEFQLLYKTSSPRRRGEEKGERFPFGGDARWAQYFSNRSSALWKGGRWAFERAMIGRCAR